MRAPTTGSPSVADIPQLAGVTHVNGPAVDGSDNGAHYFTDTPQVVACRHDRPGAVVDEGVAEEALAR